MVVNSTSSNNIYNIVLDDYSEPKDYLENVNLDLSIGIFGITNICQDITAACFKYETGYIVNFIMAVLIGPDCA